MNKRIIICLLTTALLCLAPFVGAQQPGKVPRIGFLVEGSASIRGIRIRTEAFRHGLRERGYVEGQNIVIEYRFAEGRIERFPDLAVELVRLKVDVIVTAGTAAALAGRVEDWRGVS